MLQHILLQSSLQCYTVTHVTKILNTRSYNINSGTVLTERIIHRYWYFMVWRQVWDNCYVSGLESGISSPSSTFWLVSSWSFRSYLRTSSILIPACIIHVHNTCILLLMHVKTKCAEQPGKEHTCFGLVGPPCMLCTCTRIMFSLTVHLSSPHKSK